MTEASRIDRGERTPIAYWQMDGGVSRLWGVTLNSDSVFFVRWSVTGLAEK